MKIKAFLFGIVCFLGFAGSLNIVQAAGLGGPNVGDYVYEDSEVVTNQQYEKLEDINGQIETGPNPQRLYVLVLRDGSSIRHFNDLTDNDPKLKGIPQDVVNKTGEVLYGHYHYYDIDSDENGLPDWKNNYLICDLKNNRVYFDPSDQADSYITDLMFWKLKFGLADLTSGNTDQRMEALFELAQRLNPELQKVANSKDFIYSKSYFDVKNIINSILFVLAIIVGLVIWFIIHQRNKNNPHGGGGSELGNSDYDAGFDEGYYMGSQDPFM
jgi:hypothetical protein